MSIEINGAGVITGVDSLSTPAVTNAAGSASAPSIAFTGDANTGLYSPGADQVAISTGGTGRLFIDSSGRVGLGTSSPGFQLDLKAASSSTFLHTQDSTGSYRAIYGVDSDGSVQGAVVGALSNHNLVFRTNNVERARIDTSGRLGVGTASPGFKCQVDSPIALSGSGNDYYFVAGNTSSASRRAVALGVDGVGGNAVIAGYNTFSPGLGTLIVDGSDIQVRTGSTERARIDSSGRLLVGTSTSRAANALIQVERADGDAVYEGISNFTTSNPTAGAYLLLSRTGASSIGSTTAVVSGTTLGYVRYRGYDGSGFVAAADIKAEVDGTPGTNDMPGRLVFSTTADGASSPTERMRINAAGGFKFSTNGTYEDSTSVRNEFTQTENNRGLQIRNNNASQTDTVFLVGCDRNTSNNTFYAIDYYNYGAGAYRFRVADSGNVTNTNNSYLGISDVKLKENVVDANSQWNDLKAIQVRNYNFKEGQTHTQIGLIAQEVELVSPGLVSESPDRDAEGNDLGTVTKSVNYSVLYMKAVKALQEAMERIEQLEAEMAEVKAQLS